MKGMKKLIAYLLCMAMLVGVVPMSVAAEEPVLPMAEESAVDAALFFSDLHTTATDYKPELIKSVMGGATASGLNFSSVTSVGDAFSSNEDAYAGDTSAITASIREGLGNPEIPVFYAWSDHDRGANIENYTGLLYGDNREYAKNYDEDANYYIYVISMSDMTSSTRYGVASTFTKEKLDTFTTIVENLDHSKPLFIASHQPLHDRRNDNQHAAEWYDVIYDAAELMDVTFFWGHNHTAETSVDKDGFYVAKDGSEQLLIEGKSNPVIPNFTYLNAGYLDSSDGYASACKNVVTAVAIYEDKINYTLYDADGEYDSKQEFVLNVDVHREFANAGTTDEIPENAVLTGLEVVSQPAKTNYFAGEDTTLELEGLVVNATYSDGETTVTKTVEADELEVSYDMTTAGVKEVKVAYTYGDVTLTDTFEVVSGYASYSEVVSGKDVTVAFETPEVTEVSIADNTYSSVIKNAVGSFLKNYVSYNFHLEGYTEGNKVTVTLPISEGIMVPVVYHVTSNGTVTKVQNVTLNGDGTLTFSANAIESYIVGEGAEVAVPDPKTETVTIQDAGTDTKEVYVLVNTPKANEQYIITSSGAAGSANALKENNKKGSAITINAATATIKNPYIETTDETIMWNTAGDMTFQSVNGNYYLRGENGLSFSTGTPTNWKVGQNFAYCRSKNKYRYLQFANGEWSVTAGLNTTSTSYKVYFYEKQEVEVLTTVDKVVTYSIEGNPGYVSKVVANGATAKLNSNLIITPESGAPSVTDISETANYEVYEGGDPNGIIEEIDGNNVTFTGRNGKALVRVSYTETIDGTEYEVDNYIIIVTTEPSYEAQITHDHDKNSETEYEAVDKTIVIKKVSDATRYQLGCDVVYIDENGSNDIEQPTVTWSTNRPDLATVDQNGLVSFKAGNGIVQITAVYTYESGKSVTDTVAFSISVEGYITPEDGTDAFPEYPNEGSVRFDKTAQAVGVFSETGIAQLELSMTGVPFTEGNNLDVVLMLDRSNSMTDTRIAATKAAVKVFINNIVKNTDGSYNNNRIFVGDFQGGNPKYLDTQSNINRHHFRVNQMSIDENDGYQIISSDEELQTLFDTIDTVFVKLTDNTNPKAPYGTEYAQSLEYCYDLLNASKSDGNKQFCVFMSDGIPNVYQYGEGEDDKTQSSSEMAAMFSGNNYDSRGTNYKYEYHSTLMKKNDVTVFTVGLGLHGTNSSLSGANADQCEKVASYLLNDISGPAGEVEADRDTGTTISKQDEYFFSVADANAASEMANVFGNIAVKILEAAKDVRVVDKIADKYTMVFDFPNDVIEGRLEGKNQEFYIEAKEYDLIAVPGADGTTIVDYNRGTSKSLLKVYLGEAADGSYFAASDSAGTKHATPVFNTTPFGTLFYWTTTETEENKNIAVKGADGNTYYFMEKGNGTHNMVSGAYAYGTPVIADIMHKDVITGAASKVGENTTCQNLIIATPYFVYNADTRMLVWTAEKLGTKELTLSYFLYLENSGGYVGNEEATLEGTYETNDFAHLDYTNFQGVECEQTFPIPQMTWNGAQVSYVFYLVNKDGVPVNRAGRQVPFSEAVYVTDTYTYAVTWNQADMKGELEAARIAFELVPDVYKLFDETARYDIYVYEDEVKSNKDNHFVITGEKAVNTTYVFNTKADNEKYTVPGTYNATGTNNTTKVHTGFDFSNTTVAFAVLWTPELAEDVVVIDYGLPVDINVSTNDKISGKVTSVVGPTRGLGFFGDAEMGIEINSGVIPPYLRLPQKEEINVFSGMKYGTAEVISNTAVRYTPQTMNMTDTELFYYVAETTYQDKDGTLYTASMYSSVTVIPATSIYFEDTTTFVTYKDGTFDDSKTNGVWSVDGAENNSATQDQDRPGKSNISAVIDKDNLYGYDSAYLNSASYSLGSSHKVTVSKKTNSAGAWPTATFNFTGSGFDIISLTSSDTGLIKVEVNGTTASGESKSYKWTVDTYYGYNYADGEWTPTDKNALYQIPVIKSSKDMEYGTYTVTITPMYSTNFDHAGNGSYDFYLDAIRIYDPADDGNNNTVIKDAYVADNEGWPAYTELRNMLISASDFYAADGTTKGVIFIDGIPALEDTTDDLVKDYKSYGPNNEVYLAPGQAVAFNLNASVLNASNADVASVQVAVKALGKDVNCKIYDADTNLVDAKELTIKTASDLYRDITSLDGKVVIIANTSTASDAILSITNLKVTFDADPGVEDLDLSKVATVSSETEERVGLSLRSAVKTQTAPDQGIIENGKEENAAAPEKNKMSSVAESILKNIADTIHWLKEILNR